MEQINTSNSKSEKLLWWLIAVLIAAGVFANYYFGELAWALRFTGWVVLICVLVGIAYTTATGKKIWIFAKESKIELLKVVWPSRDETLKITMVVATLVIVMSIVMWFIDSILLWIMNWLTGKLV